jgi:putative esterase
VERNYRSTRSRLLKGTSSSPMVCDWPILPTTTWPPTFLRASCTFPDRLLFPGRSALCLTAKLIIISTSPEWWATNATFWFTRHPVTTHAENKRIRSSTSCTASVRRSWTAIGRANVILDNLIAEGKVKPMIVVMPLGYGAPEILAYGSGKRPKKLQDRNFDKFRGTLLTEVIPRVEVEYPVIKERNSRAIAGLSMGGSESLFTGLNALDKFGWIGAFSAPVRPGEPSPEDFEKEFPGLDAKAAEQLHLLWIACGTDDSLIDNNRKFRAWLVTKNIKHADIETPGAHTWMVWRRNLTEFIPLLFR